MLAVLDSWRVQADFTVGHSSGEVAAACCAGFLTPAQAILAAYLRGLSAKEFSSRPKNGYAGRGGYLLMASSRTWSWALTLARCLLLVITAHLA